MKNSGFDKREINLLIITARADYGGGPEHIYRLIKSFSGNINIYIASPKDYPYWERFSEAVGSARLFEIPHRKFLLKYLLALRRFAVTNNINIIHSHGKGAGVYGRLLSALTSIKCIHTSHGVHLGRYGNVKKSVYIWIERFLGFFTKKIIAVSKGEFDLIRTFKLVNDSKLVLIPNGVFVGNSTVTDKVFTGENKKLISISRNDSAKYPELLFEIMAKLKEIDTRNKYKLTLLGSGLNNSEFRQKLADLKIEENVEITGAVNNPQDYIKESFCYISTSRSEGMPLGILEAMSYGVPVIATNVIGNRDVVEPGKTGYLYDISKPEEAAMFISGLAENFDIWKNMSLKSREIAERNYNVIRMAKEVQKEYISALENN